MEWMIVGVILAVVLALLPAIKNWVQTVHCPKCGSWFTLKFVRFDVTDKVTGRDKDRMGWHSGIRGGFRTNHTSEQPFIREFGKARYLCAKCNLYLTIETHRDKR
jgi:DNA-directed RNA polymerase subunit RPC12/RpoP